MVKVPISSQIAVSGCLLKGGNDVQVLIDDDGLVELRFHFPATVETKFFKRYVIKVTHGLHFVGQVLCIFQFAK